MAIGANVWSERRQRGDVDAGATGRRRHARLAAVVGAIALLAVMGAAVAGAGAAAGNGAGTAAIQLAATAPRGAHAIGAVSAASTESGEVVLRPRDNSALTQFIALVTNPRSSTFHQYLAPGAFAARFGPASSTLDAVRSQLQASGLTVTGVSSDHLLVSFSGSASKVESAFGTGLERYRLANGAEGQGTTGQVHVPASLSSAVAGVVGLNDLVHAHSELIHAPASVAATRPKAKTANFSHPAGSPTPCSDAQSAAQSLGGLTDDQIADSYGAFGLYGAGDTGTGANVGIYELEPFAQSDLQTFDQCYFGDTAAGQMASRLSVIPVDGGQPQGPGSGEAILDVQDVSAMAPGANIDVYEAPNTNAGALDEFASMIDKDTDQIITSSWGFCEQDEQLDDPGAQQAENFMFEQAAAQGQTVLNAAGDEGDDSCNEIESVIPPSDQNPLSVADPASQPYVLGVGGTSIQNAGQPAVETAWNDGAEWGGTGGGISQSWAMPSWQQNAQVPGIVGPTSADYTNANGVETNFGWTTGFCQETITGATAGTACRLVPDVSAQADEFTGAVTIFSASLGGWTTIGGTSSSSPIWAAMLALVNSSAACSANGETNIGFAPPLLYAVASNPSEYRASFNDITSGNNDTFGFDNGRVFPATAGYDLATGLGSPRLTGPGGTAGLAADLCGMAVAPMRPVVSSLTPDAGSVAGGQTVTINGTGFQNVAGVEVGTASASFTVNSPASITVTMPPAADTLPPGTGTAPPQDGSGPANVVVTLKNGQSSALASQEASTYDYVDETSGSSQVPSVTAVSQDAGIEGNTAPARVKIFGAGFTESGVNETTGVTFGGIPASSFHVINHFEITATPPAFSSNPACIAGLPTGETATNDICQVEVQVSNANGHSALSTILPPYEGPALSTTMDGLPLIPQGCGCEITAQPTEYDYVPTPTITSVSTSSDPGSFASELGTTVVTITGTGFDPLTFNYTDFGDPTQASSVTLAPVFQSGTEIDIVAPAIALGIGTDKVPVSVSTLAGQSNQVDANYAGVPEVTGVETTTGKTVAPASGGTPITITGQGFSDAIAPLMFIDSVPPPAGMPPASIGTQYTFTSSNGLTISTETVEQNPAMVDTEVCSVTACSSPSSADQLTLYPPGNPSVTSVSPSSGPGVGGTAVVINGQNLGCVTGVFFGGVAASQFANAPGPLDCGSTTEVDATAPAGTVGTTVPVKVTTTEGDDTGIGESPSTASFTYTANPHPPTATPSPDSLSFGAETVGRSTGSQSITISNSGAESLTIGTAAIIGADVHDFVLTSDGCFDETLATSEHCTVSVSFAPVGLGARSATLEVPSNDPSSPLRISLQGTGTLGSPPPASVATTATLGNQHISLTTPSPQACVASPKRLSVRLTSTTRSKGTKLKFSRAAFYIDRGVKHRRRVYKPNAIAHRLPVGLNLSIARLKSGSHTLKVVVSYKESKIRHGVKQTVTVSKTLRAKFTVC
jgi:Pro-kumamolisin, activation domain/IPT/TIG domain/HYDIN/CFA65/VesB-like, Ig-like domain